MGRSINKALLLGNVGSEPEIKTTASGKKVAKFSLATSYGSGDKEKTSWHRVTAWDRTAEIIESYVHKGDKLYVEGSIEYSQTEDDSGKPRYWTDIVAREVILLGNGKQTGDTPSNSKPAKVGGSPFDDDDEDLPFT